MCQGNPETFADIATAVSSGTIVAGTMLAAFATLTAFPIVGGIAGAIVISIGTLLPLLWPEPSEPNLVWEEFMIHGATISIQKPILDTVREQSLAYLNGFRDLLIYYENGLKEWQQHPNPDTARLVAIRFENANASFVENMPQLRLPTYDTILLSSYAQAANMHLNLLQQGVEFADQWKTTNQPFSPTQKTSNVYYNELLAHIEKYINYCTETYKKGLNILKKTTDISWDTYNTYRRDMTLTVLDLIVLFPNYDTKKYPKGTKYEITRKIYSNSFGVNIIGAEDIDELENALTLKPDLYSTLRGFIFNTTFGTSVNYLSGISNIYSHANISSSTNDGPFYGKSDGKLDRLVMPSGRNIIRLYFSRNKHNLALPVVPPLYAADQIVNLKLFHGTEPSNYTQYLPDNKVLDYENTDLSFPKYSEYLNSILMISPGTLSLGLNPTNIYVFAWTHNSVDQQNTILRNTITQIPAVKGTSLEKKSKVIQGPGHTGGDLVDLKDRLELSCRHSDTQQSYFIRIRYASNSSLNNRAQISLTIPGVAMVGVVILSETFSGTDYNNLKFCDFGCFQFQAAITLKPSQNIFLIVNRLDENLNTSLLIDKIEFIPITDSMRENREKQQLEKAKRTVEDFFISAEKQNIKIDITDNQIDQTANLVDSLSEELYPQEKMMLLDEIKHAKQLSQSRNILNNGDFESLTGWITSNNITIQTGNTLFKGNSLQMSGARITEINNSIFPTYVYQKIDESKLKPYTRYTIRGFIGSSKDLELLVTRYDKEINTIMNVPNDLTSIHSTIPYSEPNVCKSESYSFIDEKNYANNQLSPNITTSDCKPDVCKKNNIKSYT